MNKIKLTIVIPAYNEEKIIKKTITKILSFMSKKGYSWEIIVSDDGSYDATSKIVSQFNNKKVVLIRSVKNQGKGAALKRGILAAKGEYIIFMDADLSVPLKNIDYFLDELEKGIDVVIASRRVEGARILVHQPWLREAMGRFYTLLSKLATNTNLSDFTCGFKGFSRKAARKIFLRSLIKRWAYDSEILFLAKKFDFKIKEMPVFWKNRSDTRVRLKSVILETLLDLIKIRYFDICGKYAEKS